MKATEKLIPLAKVIERAGIGRTKIRELMAAGQFPQVVHIGTSARWSELEVDAWIEAQKAQRRAS